MSRFVSLAAPGLLLLLATSAAAQAPVLRILPAKAPVIDGNAADWPAGAPKLPLDGPDGHATIRLAADDENFYACFEVRDESPLRNSAARPEEMLKGGDAVGLYFGAGPDRYERVMFAPQRNGAPTVYLYRPRSELNKPYTFVSPAGTVKFDYVAPFPEAKVALKPAPGGYVAEASLPWKALGYEGVPKRFAFDAQVIFSDPAGTTNAGSVWGFTKGGPALTIEDLPTEAQLYPETWGQAIVMPNIPFWMVEPVRDPDTVPPGIPIKINLPRGGRLSVVIQDDKGWILRELVKAEPRRAGVQTIEWDGRDRYGEVLPPGTYRWKALLFDGMSSRFMGSVGSSGRPPYRTPDGLGAIGGQHGVPTALAADAGGVYMSSGGEEGQPAIRKVDAVTGAALWKRSAGGFGFASAIATGDGMACLLNFSRSGGAYGTDLIRVDPATGLDVPMGEIKARLRLPVPGDTHFGGLAIVAKKAYFSIPTSNVINGIDLETGAAIPPLSVTMPLGLYRADATHLLVCSGDSILKIDVTSGTSSPVLTGLSQPRAVARDARGNLYVSDLGTVQQIKKFDAAGKLLDAWGVPGGKPATQTTYDPVAFKNITVLAVGPDNNLWACESLPLPKRFVKLSLEGKWLEDFYGPVAYNTFGPDLDDLSTVYYNPGGNDATPRFVRTHVDYATYADNPNNPGAAWKIEAIYDLSLGADGQTQNTLMRDVAQTGYGHVFVFTGANGKRYLFRPSKMNRAASAPGAGLWVWDKETWVPAVFLASAAKEGTPSWIDHNADGLPQDDEYFTFPQNTTYSWIRRDLTLEGFSGTLAPASIDARGVPDYKGGKFTPYATTPPPSVEGGWTFFSNVSEGAIYYAVNWGPGRSLSFWDRADENRIVKVQNGVEQWVIGEHSSRPNNTQLSTVSTISGSVDGILLAGTVEPSNYVAYTTDGFTLGNVLVDANGVKPSVGPNVINIESFTGLFVKDPKTGKKVLFAVSSGDDRILEVTGPGQTTRLEGEVKLDTSRPRFVEPPTSTVIPYQSWYGNAVRGAAVDGQDTEWYPDARGLPLMEGQTAVADLRLRRDGGTLCLLADVADTTPLQTGEGLELKLSPGATGPTYTLFLSGKPGGKDGWTGTCLLQKDGAAVKATGLKIAIAPRWRGLGYRLEAEIPLALLPELTISKPQVFRRAAKDGRTGKLTALGSQKADLPDLKSGVQINAAVIRTENGTANRAVWPAQGTGTAEVP